MKCAKCKQTVRCMRCGAAVSEEHTADEGGAAVAPSISDELHKRCVCVEVSKGVMREVLLLSDVAEILAMLAPSSAERS